MKTASLCLMTVLTVAVPLAASAQQNVARGTATDIKYCNALAKSYSTMFPAQEAMGVSDVVTLSRCDTETQATIVVLEKKLADKKIDLPHDDRIAQPPAGAAPGHTQ